jgi:hypothetical protein
MAMQRGKTVLTYVALIWAFILGPSICLHAQETGKKEADKEKGGAATPTPSGTPKPKIIPGGAVEKRTPSGAIKRVPPSDVTGPPEPEATEAEETVTPGPSAAEESDPILSWAPYIERFDQPAREKYMEAARVRLANYIWESQHRQAVFQWQFCSSRVIFVAVLALVFAGIVFAAVQFFSVLGRKREAEASESEEITEFVASVKGIKVRSPVLGVVILVISMVFFYLYLVYVYPIKAIY